MVATRRSWVRVGAILASVPLLLAGCASVRRIRIQGTVLAGQQAQGNLQVYLVSPEGKRSTTVTDANGTFQFEATAAPSKQYVLLAKKQGFDYAFEQITVPGHLELGFLTADLKLQPPRMAYDPVSFQSEPETVEVFYGTDRAPTGKTSPSDYYANAASEEGRVSLGICKVSLPPGHRIGRIEEPVLPEWVIKPDPKKHFVVVGLEPLGTDEFYGKLAARVALSDRKDAFVFVHGYSESFKDAVLRTAQLRSDLRFKGAAVLFSWPSSGGIMPYTSDEEMVQATVPHLEAFLQEIVARSGATKIHLIAHSMGSRALVNALNYIAGLDRLHSSTGQGETVVHRFQQIILASPDINEQVVRNVSRAIKENGDRITLYTSRSDWILWLSSKVHWGVSRAGRDLLVLPGIDTVDFTPVDGHSGFADNSWVVNDIVRLLNDGAPPDQRFPLKKMTLGSLIYWLLQPN